MEQILCASLFPHPLLSKVDMHDTDSITDQPGKVANPARGQLNREN